MGRWTVPSDIEPDGDGIRWRVDQEGGDEAQAGPRMLEGFIRLADADAEAVVKYARRWGVLGLCKHGLPDTHTIEVGRYLRRPVVSGSMVCAHPMASDKSWWYEPLAAWQDLARQAKATLTLAVALHRQELGDPEEWAILPEYLLEIVEPPVGPTPGHALEFRRSWDPTPTSAPTTLEDGRAALAWHIDHWLHWGQVRNRFRWDDRSPALELQPHGLFGAIAMQVASRVTGRDALAICHNCQMPYQPTKRPDPNRRNYCPQCREAGAPQRDARRDYRARMANTSNRGGPTA